MKVIAAAILSMLPVLAACSSPTPPSFYDTAALTSKPPGAVIAAEPFTPTIPGAAAYRVLYNSTDINGNIIPVSGVVYIPLALPPAAGRSIVAWAHPTTGIAPACAPSLDSGGIGGITLAQSIPGLADFIAAGDIVTATDYQGMGAPGTHPYLIGRAEGADILDSVRAASALPGADANGKFAVWGHSQGAQAALFAGQMAHSYAPELHLVGVAAAAPPTYLPGEFAEPMSNTGDRILNSYVYDTWSITYHAPVTSVIQPAAVPALQKTAAQCINSIGAGIAALRAAGALPANFRAPDASHTQPWFGLFDANSPGHAPPGAPLLIVQGTKDPTVEPYWTRAFVARVCAKHETLDYVEFKGVKHLLIAYKSKSLVTAWIANRFAGQPPPDTCRK
jgi:pimeloyl-ACP methyl ester carboxylesterase